MEKDPHIVRTDGRITYLPRDEEIIREERWNYWHFQDMCLEPDYWTCGDPSIDYDPDEEYFSS